MKLNPLSDDELNDPAFQLLLVACLEQLERGEGVDFERLAARHPQYAGALREFLDDEEALRRMAGEVRDSLSGRSGSGQDFVPPAERNGAGDETIDSRSLLGGPAPGDRLRYIGEYEILAEIARGGMGIVYKARQPKLQRVVALKMILAGQFADETDIERFRREAQAAARLNHPHIVAVHEVGEYEGHHYFTMDFVEGRSLAEQIREETVAPKRAGQLVASLANAVAYAHGQGTLHRDLKPANILLNSEGTPKITDFGLAKMIGAEDAEARSALTASGQILGTPSYMSPEQASGKLDLVGPATDIYSLGAILYACLTGRAPHVAETPVDTLLQVAHHDPVPPRSLNPAIPKDLETICLKCLAKSPQQRYETAQALADDLNRWLEGRPIKARPTGILRRTGKWCRRHPARAALIALLLLAALTTTLLWRRAERASELAAQQLYVNRVALAEREWQVNNRSRAMELLMDSDERHRGWEWRFVSRLCFATPHIDLPTTNRGVARAVFDPTGKYLATGDGERIRVWDAVTLQLLAEVPQAARHFCFSPDGNTLAIAVGEEVRLLSSAAWRAGEPLLSTAAPVRCVAYDSKGEHLAVLDETSHVTVIRAADGQEVSRFQVSEQERQGPDWMQFDPRTTHLLVSLPMEPTGIWDPLRGERIERVSPPEHEALRDAFACAMSVSGTRVAYKPGIRWSRKSVFVRDAGRKKVFTITLNDDATAVALSPDGQTLAVCVREVNLGVEDLPRDRNDITGFLAGMAMLASRSRPWRGDVHLYDVESGRLLRTLRGHIGDVSTDGLAFSPDGRRLVSAGGFSVALDSREVRGELKLWETRDTPPSLVLRGHSAELSHVVFSPDGRRIASGDKEGVVCIWDRSGALFRTFQLRGGEVRGIAFARDHQLVTADPADVAWWDVTTGEELFRLGQGRGNGGPEAMMPENERKSGGKREAPETLDGEILALSGKGSSRLLACVTRGANYLIDTAERRVVRRERLSSQERPTAAAFAPGGRQVAYTYYYDLHGELKTFDTLSGRERIHVQSDQVGNPFRTGWGLLDAAFSPDGRRVVGVGNNGPGLVWDTRGGARLMELNGHSGFIWGVAWSPDGTRIATGSTDHTIKLWDAATGRELMTLRGHDGSVTDLVFSPEGDELVSVGSDRTVRIWNADLEGLKKHLETGALRTRGKRAATGAG